MGLNIGSFKSLSQASGASSALRTQQYLSKNALKSIKSENIGYICPDGTINFQSAKTAEEYAKNAVVKAVRQANPYEKAVIVDKNRITYEHNGTQMNCTVPITAKGLMVHGHPDLYAKGGAFPFSAADYHSFIVIPGLEKTVIYNTLGEKAEMVKLPAKWWERLLPSQSILGAKIGVCNGEYNKALLDKNGAKQLNKLALKALWAKITKNPEAAKKYIEQNLNLYNKLLQESFSEAGAKRLHEFWVKSARRLGVDYSTNFSNLV